MVFPMMQYTIQRKMYADPRKAVYTSNNDA